MYKITFVLDHGTDAGPRTVVHKASALNPETAVARATRDLADKGYLGCIFSVQVEKANG